MEKVFIYDTTLRDGAQGRGVTFTLEDKLRVTKLLDDFGVSYIEGGWPGSNPKDVEYFEKVKSINLKNSKITAFGSTRRKNASVEEDQNLKALIDSGVSVVTIFGKSWDLHVTEILGATLEENVLMIQESVSYLKSKGLEVIYDAEHFFDGYKANKEYAKLTLEAAERGGADWIVLCDTNGGTLPEEVARAVEEVKKSVSAALGIHAHNDAELGVANSLAAVSVGCRQVQGTINGFGERCGNANLISLIPTLQLKYQYDCVSKEKLKGLSELSRRVYEIANINANPQAPYVGVCSFTHKGGVHVSAVEKLPHSYEHIYPELVGNVRHVVLSELSGRGNLRMRAEQAGLSMDGAEAELLQKLKQLEHEGLSFENAEGSFDLFVMRSKNDYVTPFTVKESMVVSEKRGEEIKGVEAIVKVIVDGELLHTAACGDGPVHALDQALRKALLPRYPMLEAVHLTDYKVRILNPDKATGAVTRVVIEASTEHDSWSTVGCSPNIIEASLQALTDSYELYLSNLSIAQKRYDAESIFASS